MKIIFQQTKLKVLNYSLLIVLITSLIFTSCNKGSEDSISKVNTSEGTYFSIIDFTKDQWQSFKGQPYAIKQITTLNGATDTVMLSALTMKWSPIFKIFFESDISDPKFLDQYNFAMFEETTTEARTFTYTAKDPKLFTQKLEILADLFSNKIRSIYIETQKENFWNSETQKLYYAPLKVIQIQEYNNPLLGKNKDLVVMYKFM